MQMSNPFSVLLPFAEVHDLQAADLAAAIRRLYPSARVTGWGGAGEPMQGERGILLSVNSVDLAVTNLKNAAPPEAFSGGNQPNFYWQDAKADIQLHKSHMFVMEAADGDISRSIDRASAVTMVVDALSHLVRPMGVMWINAKNLVRIDHFAKLMESFRAKGAIPAGVWIRLLIASLPPASAAAKPETVAGTFGLQLFDSPNIEIHSTRLQSADCLSAALSYAESKLATGQPTWNEATTNIEDLASFRIERLDNGLFGIGPVAKLTHTN